jgi:3D (Asp-Asp-Asp) domain-containing protein
MSRKRFNGVGWLLILLVIISGSALMTYIQQELRIQELVNTIEKQETIIANNEVILSGNINQLRIELNETREDLRALEGELNNLKELNLEEFPSFEAEVSWYTAGFESTGKNPDHPNYGITASGKYVKENHTIAADGSIPFGTKILIDDIIYTVEDRGGLIYDNRLDIYVDDLNEVPPEGRIKKEVYILEWGV